MNEDRIVGPFTFKQFLHVAGGVALIYLLFNYFGGMLGIVLSILVAGTTFVFVRQNVPEPLNETTLRQKRTELGAEEFERWRQKKIAEIQSRITDREQKGLSPVPSLIKIMELLQTKV